MKEIKRKSILVASDAHGKTGNIEKLLRSKQYDALVFCGDGEGIEKNFATMPGCPAELIIVRGNNDYNFGIPFSAIYQIGNKNVLITHGHLYELYQGYGNLVRSVKEKKCDMCIFGHIHKPLFYETEGVLLINPGSVSEPRQSGGIPTCMELEISESEILVRLININTLSEEKTYSVSNN